MKVQIKGFWETSLLDWPGKLTAVLFLPGCNLRCPYCHNHPLVINPERFEDIPLEYILRRLKGLKGWLDGVCVTGGEPTVAPKLPFLLEKLKGEGWAVKLDTNGAFPGLIKGLIRRGLVDCVAMDIKAPLDSRSYSRCAGVSVDISAIRQSISLLASEGIDYTFRMTVVPTLLTEEQVYEAAFQLVGTRRLLLQDFNPSDPLSTELRGIKPFGEMRLQRMQGRVDTILGERGDSYHESPTVGRGETLQRMYTSIDGSVQGKGLLHIQRGR
jgi:pyruvate formate lyase activating enzyme